MFVIRFEDSQTLVGGEKYTYYTAKTIDEAFKLSEKIEGILDQEELKKIRENNKNIIVSRYCLILLNQKMNEVLKEKGIINNKITMII